MNNKSTAEIINSVNRQLNENPIHLRGRVIHGFGRGKKIQYPTANIDYEKLKEKIDHLPDGVYYGWTRILPKSQVYMSAISIGRNIHFKVESRTFEDHIIHKFRCDFYGSEIEVVICGYLRPMMVFKSLDDLLREFSDNVRSIKSILSTERHLLIKQEFFEEDYSDLSFCQEQKELGNNSKIVKEIEAGENC